MGRLGGVWRRRLFKREKESKGKQIGYHGVKKKKKRRAGCRWNLLSSRRCSSIRALKGGRRNGVRGGRNKSVQKKHKVFRYLSQEAVSGVRKKGSRLRKGEDETCSPPKI